MLSKSSSNPKARIIYTTGINQFISHWQRCIDCNSSYILINKGVFEPSYNDLKFTIQNCNYVCTKLISCFDLHAVRHYRDETLKF